MSIPLKDILFIDIETASNVGEYKDLSPNMQQQWDKKSSFLKNEEELSSNELYFDRAGIYAEFGRVICIAIGIARTDKNGEHSLRVKVIAGHDEAILLSEFKELMEAKFSEDVAFCAHNGKEFDYPYLCRRMLINGIKIPGALDIAGKKPWEVKHLDTLNMWKFGDYKNYTSLDLLAGLFDIESSKSDIDGSMVNHAYYHEDGLEKISLYCQRDVSVLAQLYLKLQSMGSISEENIELLPIEIIEDGR